MRIFGGTRILRPRHRRALPRRSAGRALRQARHRRRTQSQHDFHHRTDDQRRQGGDPRTGRRLDDRHQGPQPVSAVGTHHSGDRNGFRSTDDLRRYAPAAAMDRASLHEARRRRALGPAHPLQVALANGSSDGLRTLPCRRRHRRTARRTLRADRRRAARPVERTTVSRQPGIGCCRRLWTRPVVAGVRHRPAAAAARAARCGARHTTRTGGRPVLGYRPGNRP